MIWVVVRRMEPSAVLWTSMVAPARAAPLVSTTKPEMAPSTAVCACAETSGCVARAEHHNRDVRRNSGEGRACLYAVTADAVTTERHALSPRK